MSQEERDALSKDKFAFPAQRKAPIDMIRPYRFPPL